MGIEPPNRAGQLTQNEILGLDEDVRCCGQCLWFYPLGDNRGQCTVQDPGRRPSSYPDVLGGDRACNKFTGIT